MRIMYVSLLLALLAACGVKRDLTLPNHHRDSESSSSSSIE